MAAPPSWTGLLAVAAVGGVAMAGYLQSTEVEVSAPVATPAPAWRPANPAPSRSPRTIPTFALTGYGVFDGSAFSTEAQNLAQKKNAADLIDDLRARPGAQAGAVADALALKLRRGEADPAAAARAVQPLAITHDSEARRGALRALMQAGSAGEESLLNLLNGLTAGAAVPVQLDVLAALQQMSPQSEELVQAVAARLGGDQAPAVQEAAAAALAHMGPEGAVALRQALSDLRAAGVPDAGALTQQMEVLLQALPPPR